MLTEAHLGATAGCGPFSEAQIEGSVYSGESAVSRSRLSSDDGQSQRRPVRWSARAPFSYSRTGSRIFVHATSLYHWEVAGTPGHSGVLAKVVVQQAVEILPKTMWMRSCHQDTCWLVSDLREESKAEEEEVSLVSISANTVRVYMC